MILFCRIAVETKNLNDRRETAMFQPPTKFISPSYANRSPVRCTVVVDVIEDKKFELTFTATNTDSAVCRNDRFAKSQITLVAEFS